MKEAVIIGAVRTPVGKYMGALKTVEAYDLAAIALAGAVSQANIDPALVDEVVMGQSYQNGEYVNIARMALLKAGWPESIPGITLDRRCCTGLDVVRYAAALIASGQAEIVVAGGVESMSNAEFYLPGSMKWGVGGAKGMPKGHGDLAIWGLPFYDRIQRARVMSQPQDRYGILPSMMSWAETAAKEENVSRQSCDEWAVESHKKACAAMEAGKFRDEIVPVPVMQTKGEPVIVERDENPRADTTLEKLLKLKPVLGGVCTAGTVPIAVEKALVQAGLNMGQMDLIEIQEAFAAQVLADLNEMGVGPTDYPRINVNGSGISLGHPIACTGTRVLVTLLHEMRRRGARYGLECICGGGGLGIAAVFERKTEK
ncbi:MAG: acetyl-CoA C-acyltransferase [Deltaproteobacteria bacterium]|nr:acetyl-CoA C-acyltransferase [Deltaproteobacteria bacterium]